MKRFILNLVIGAALCTHPAYALSELPSDSRIVQLRYSANDIFTIYTLYGYQTSIEFARNEQVVTISLGDRSNWQIVPADYRLYIRPMDDHLSTNMTVVTSKRTYNFDLKSGSGSLEENKNLIYVARFTYEDARPSAVPAMPAVMPMLPVSPAIAATPPARNYQYTFTGPDALAPTEVYDDGKSTFIRYPNMGKSWPKVYTMASDGKRLPITAGLRDGAMVIPTVQSQLILVHGDKQEVHLFNEQMASR